MKRLDTYVLILLLIGGLVFTFYTYGRYQYLSGFIEAAQQIMQGGEDYEDPDLYFDNQPTNRLRS